MPKGVLYRSHADRQTDRHESEYRGHPFRVSGFFKFSFNLSSRSGPTGIIKPLENKIYMSCNVLFSSDSCFTDFLIFFFLQQQKSNRNCPNHKPKWRPPTGPNSVQENKTYAEKHYYLFARASKIKRL